MINISGKWIFFISSYIPLYFIFIIQGILSLIDNYIQYNSTIDESYPLSLLLPYTRENTFLKDNIGSIGLIIFFIILSLVSFQLLKSTLKDTGRTSDFCKLYNIQKYNPAITEYILVYILPFISTSIFEIKDLITFIIVFLIIGILQVKNDLVYTNPVLYILNYNIYTFKKDSPDAFNDSILITTDSILELKRSGVISEDNSINIRTSPLSQHAYYIKKR